MCVVCVGINKKKLYDRLYLNILLEIQGFRVTMVHGENKGERGEGNA